MKTLTLFALAFAGTVALTSCDRSHSETRSHAEQNSDPDFFVALTTAAGLRQGNDVLFLGTPVGRVESIKPHASGLIVGVKLNGPFRGQMHRGAKARAVRDERTGFTLLWIIGGNDPSLPPLQESDTIFEANLLEALAENCSPGAAARATNGAREATIGLLDAATHGIDKLKEHLKENNPTEASSATPTEEN